MFCNSLSCFQWCPQHSSLRVRGGLLRGHPQHHTFALQQGEQHVPEPWMLTRLTSPAWKKEVEMRLDIITYGYCLTLTSFGSSNHKPSLGAGDDENHCPVSSKPMHHILFAFKLLLLLPQHCWHFQKACVLDSTTHRAHSHNSTRHWPWSTSCSALPQGLSILGEPFHLVRCSNQCLQDPETYQNQLSAIERSATDQFGLLTLQMLLSDIKMFLAARSRCTNPILDR